jgi:hypothetical protein
LMRPRLALERDDIRSQLLTENFVVLGSLLSFRVPDRELQSI